MWAVSGPPVTPENLVCHGLEGNGSASVGVVRTPISPHCRQGSCPGPDTFQGDRSGIADGRLRTPKALKLGSRTSRDFLRGTRASTRRSMRRVEGMILFPCSGAPEKRKRHVPGSQCGMERELMDIFQSVEIVQHRRRDPGFRGARLCSPRWPGTRTSRARTGPGMPVAHASCRCAIPQERDRRPSGWTGGAPR